MHDLNLLTDLAFLLTVAVGLGLLATRLGLPAVLAYVLTGTLLGPPGLGLVSKGHDLNTVAELGVIVLLFTVGLEFSLTELKRSWRTVILAGGGQVLLTTAIVFGAAFAIGRSWKEALIWGCMVALSSTAVVLRLLEARGEQKAAQGRLITGVLIFQDLCIVPMMLLIPMLAGNGSGNGLVDIGRVLLTAVGIVAAVVFLSQAVVPRLLRRVAATRNREMFLLAVLAIAGLTAWVTSLTGLSLALGAFLAGVVLADTEYAHQAMADVLPLRAVTMCVFFVTVGMLFDVEMLTEHPFIVIGFTSYLFLTKLVAMWAVGVLMRFPVQLAAASAVALAQVGEFSFVLADSAAKEGLILPEAVRLFLTASVVTIAITPIAMIQFPKLLAGSRALEPLEALLDGRASTPDLQNAEHDHHDHVIVAGLGVGGRTLIAALELAGRSFVIVELNPDTVARERARGRNVVYGDITSPEVLAHAGLQRAAVVVLVVSDPAATHRATEVITELAPQIPVVLRTRFVAEEGHERAPNVEVFSEEFAGAATLTTSVLRRLNVTNGDAIVTALVRAHEKLPPGEEDELPPPAAHAAHTKADAVEERQSTEEVPRPPA